MTPIVVVALGILAALWGSAFPMIKVGLDGLSAPHLTLMRHMVASLAFVPLLLAFRARLRPALADVPYFFLLGTLGLFVYHLALNYGEMRVSAGAASLIIASAPAITALLAYFMVGDRMPRLGWIGSLVAFGGVGLIVLGNGGTDAGPGLNAFAWLIVLSAVVTSFFAILQRRMFARYRPIEVAAFATWAGTVPMLAFLPGLPADAADAGAQALAASVYIGVFPSAIAYTLFAFALSRAPVTLVTTFLYLVPVFSLAASWALIGEIPSSATVAGGLVVIAGIVLVNYAKQRAARRVAVAGALRGT